MGWWWNSDPQTPVLTPNDPIPDPQPTTSEPPASPREIADKPYRVPEEEDQQQPQHAPTNPSKPLSRDEQADADLASLLSTLAAENAQHASTRAARLDSSDVVIPTSMPSRRGKGSTDPPTSPTTTTITTITSPSDPTATLTPSLYPSTMSCRAAFDSAFYCQSLGGKFNDIYRYGELRACSEHWARFWFCMRTKSQPEPRRGDMIREHYRQRAAKYKLGPSSEDVWEARTEPVGEAFGRDPDAEGVL